MENSDYIEILGQQARGTNIIPCRVFNRNNNNIVFRT